MRPRLAGLPLTRCGRPDDRAAVCLEAYTMKIGMISAVVALLASTACMTLPKPGELNTSLVLWPRAVSEQCDFEHPRRDGAYAVSMSRSLEAGSSSRGPVTSRTYTVRNAQLRVRPEAGQEFCLAIVRGETFSEPEAVIGFDVTAIGTDAFEVRPASARIARSAVSGDEVGVSVGIAAGQYRPQGSIPGSSAMFDIGAVKVGGAAKPLRQQAQPLSWPNSGGQIDILRIGVVVSETRPGHSAAISQDALSSTLTASH